MRYLVWYRENTYIDKKPTVKRYFIKVLLYTVLIHNLFSSMLVPTVFLHPPRHCFWFHQPHHHCLLALFRIQFHPTWKDLHSHQRKKKIIDGIEHDQDEKLS